VLDSGEDLRMRLRSWEDESRSWWLSWKGNATWSFEQTPATAVIPKARSNGEGD